MSTGKKNEAEEWGNPEEIEGWQYSEAKELLISDIIDEIIPDDMDWEEAFLQRPEYVLTKRHLFRNRLRDCRAHAKASMSLAERDAAAWGHDRKLYPAPMLNCRGEPRWEGSLAQHYLKKDFDDAENNGERIFPIQLYQSRPEYYKHYSLKTIREHIYQEKRFFKYCTWRNDAEAEKTKQRQEMAAKVLEREQKAKEVAAKKETKQFEAAIRKQEREDAKQARDEEKKCKQAERKAKSEASKAKAEAQRQAKVAAINAKKSSKSK